MNGGGPLAAPLRALRHVPVVVDDVGLVPRLATAAASAPAVDGLTLDVGELVRWTRAWMVACQGVLHERGVIGTLPPWTVPLPVADLPTLKGDPEHRRRDAALALLDRAGAVTRAVDGRAVTLAESAFVEHRAGLEVEWAAVSRAARFEPAALLVARALADLVVPPAEPAPVTLGELAQRTGYAPKQVRVALRRLTDAGVLRTSESAGMATQYCFGTVAVPGPSSAIGQPVRQAVPAGPAVPEVSAPPVAPPALPGTGRAVALRLTLNGVTLSLGAGLAPHVELGPDGVPHVSFDPPS